jgi:hypothetical protein
MTSSDSNASATRSAAPSSPLTPETSWRTRDRVPGPAQPAGARPPRQQRMKSRAACKGSQAPALRRSGRPDREIPPPPALAHDRARRPTPPDAPTIATAPYEARHYRPPPVPRLEIFSTRRLRLPAPAPRRRGPSTSMSCRKDFSRASRPSAPNVRRSPSFSSAAPVVTPRSTSPVIQCRVKR